MIKTDQKYYTRSEVNRFKDKVSKENFSILVSYLSNKQLSKTIFGFIEKDGAIHFKLKHTFLVVSR